MTQIEVYLEVSARRTFACAADWPGWCRSGRGEAEALDALAAYGVRYAKVMRGARIPFDAPDNAAQLVVVERLAGNATTDFGAPGAIPSADERAIDESELQRLQSILEASWQAFDASEVAGRGRQLSVGPRGGGRSLAKIVEHVVGAEESYLRSLGSRPITPAAGDQRVRIREAREQVLVAVGAHVRGVVLPNASNVRRPWPARYFTRRASWHVLDHAWEIEDRIIPT